MKSTAATDTAFLLDYREGLVKTIEYYERQRAEATRPQDKRLAARRLNVAKRRLVDSFAD